MKNNYDSFKKDRISVWKSVFTLMAVLLSCQNISAQLTIPANNAFTTTSNRPLGAFYGHDRTASIYTASEMGIASGSTITGVRYYVQTAPAPKTLPVYIYMKNVFASTFSAGIYNSTLIGSTTVHSSILEGSSVTAGRWVTLQLSTPFVYTGNNLQILVATDISDDPGQGVTDKTFRWSAANGQTQTWQSNIAATFPGNGTVTNSKPNIQILYDTPGAVGTLSWDYTAMTVLENRTHTISVNRSGGSTGAVSVNYATSDGTAIAGTDYTPTSGTLTWADGDMAPKTFTLTTSADFVLDDAETINITLSNPVGTTIVGANESVITITDVLPPMSGSYTVGTGGDYPSLTNSGGIFQAINTRLDGVSGPLTINIISDLTGENGNNALNEIAGGHSVLIQPFGGARTVTGSVSNSVLNLGLIRFEGTDNVTINGSLTGATAASCQIGGDASLRQLTFVNNTSGTSAAILFQSQASGANNNTVKNINTVGYSAAGGYGIMFRVFPSSIAIPSTAHNENNRVENCAPRKTSVGIYSVGVSPSNQNNNLVITQNDVTGMGTDRVSRSAIYIFNEDNPQVTFNKVFVNNITGSSNSETVGLAIGAGQAYANTVSSGGISGALVANNWITGVISTVDLGGSTAGIAISGTASGSPNIVQNNMISNVSGLSQYTYNVAGIWVVGAVASVTKLYNNTINLYGDRGSVSNQSPSYGIALSGLDPSLEMRNNIVTTTQIATGGGFVKTYAFGTLSTTFDNLVSDNNVFYSGGVQDGGFRSGALINNAGTSYATLADWTAATSKDANSIEVQPVFTAATDLHLVAGSNPTIDGIGTPIASVVNDFDCQPRNATNPTPGADETNFTGFTISASAGTNGTISPAGTTAVASNGNQTYTITANCGYNINDVVVDGVSQGSISTYTFTNVTANHTISATYSGQLPTITVGGPTTFCTGGSVVLTSSSATGNTWNTGETTQSISAQASINYWVTVNNGTCNSPQSNPVTVAITPPPTAPTITFSGSASFCEGGSRTLTSSAATGNIWSTGATTQSIVVTTSGTYTVSNNSGSCLSAPSAGTTITVIPRPATPTITASGSTTFCNGGNVVLTSSSPTGNTWSNGATTQSITAISSNTYTVTVSGGGCTSLPSEPVTTTVVLIPTRPTVTVTGTQTFCEGGSVVLTSSATTGNLWSNGETTQSITVTTSGVYTVTTTVNGCTSNPSIAKTITVTPAPATPTIAAGGPTTFCTGGSVVLTSSSTTGNLWSNGATTQSITVSASGTYTVTVTSGSCTSAASAGTTVTVNSLPTIPTITAGGATTFCQGGSVVLTSSSATGNLWSNGATTQSITVSAAGTYTVSVDNGSCASGTSLGTTVTINPLPATPTITASGATTFCTGGSVVLTSSSTTGNVWSNGATTQSITVSTSGTYSVTVNGTCTSVPSAGTTVTVNPLPATPTISASGATTFCEGGSVVLTSSSATGNVWSNGATTQSITVSTSGTYSVTVNGTCTSAPSAGTTVTVNPLPATPTVSASGATMFCEGGSVVLTSSSATGNVWSNGATTQSITVSTSGTYSVTVNGTCTSAPSAGTTVTVNPLPATPTISASGATTFCEGGSVVLTSSSATGNVWSNGATTQSITVSDSGTYSVSVNAGNCDSLPSTVTAVTVNALPDAGVTQSGGIVTATQSGATYQWFTCAGQEIGNETGQTFTPTTTGDYYVVISNGDCTVTSVCISVSELDTHDFAHNRFRIYPNPVSDLLNIEYTGVLTQVDVFNMVGQKVISRSADGTSAQIDMSHLPAGTFFVKIASGNAFQTFKVIRK